MEKNALNLPVLFEPLLDAGFSLSFTGFSAIDNYMGLNPLPFVFLETGAGLPELARFLGGIRFPGPRLAHAALEEAGTDAAGPPGGSSPPDAVPGGKGPSGGPGRTWYFRCLDGDENPGRAAGGRDAGEDPAEAYSVLSFSQDCKTRRFRDPLGVYPLVREFLRAPDRPPERTGPWWSLLNPGAGRYRAAMEAALILARYTDGSEAPVKDAAALIAELPGEGPDPLPEAQRTLLTGILVSPFPGGALELLKTTGFIRKFWPELGLLEGVDHSKEFHPEGNVWNHTLETFRYRKPLGRGSGEKNGGYDLRLSLGLLLHDTGKPLAESSGSRRFDGHAELGARQARRFLDRLGFAAPLVEDIRYLVKNHMLPAALPRLPLPRTEGIMASPLFPTLMELYRCDESSSYRGPEGYYESSSTYQAYLKYRRNPYRFADGKKIG
jgi:poly(A) polymerase